MLPQQLKPYSRYIFAALAVMLVTAWFSVGFYHPDEHFQILEFANFKMGYSPASDLPWEFGARCRPALQPLLVVAVAKLMAPGGHADPFILAFLLRVVAALLTFMATVRFCATFIGELPTDKSRRNLVLLTFFLWFVPYFGVRFTAETLSGDLMVLALTLLLGTASKGSPKTAATLLAGLLLAVSVYLRLQVAFACAGLGLWALLLGRWPIRQWVLLLAGATVGLFIGLLADRWFYGAWVFTPYNYFDVNILKNVAAKFGVDPWWYYFVLFFNLGIPPISLLLMLLFFRGVLQQPRHVFTFICVAFFLGHFAVGHKEMRFLLPVILPFLGLVLKGSGEIPLKAWQQVTFNVLLKISVVMNVAFLLFKMCTPAEEIVKYYQYINSECKHGQQSIVGLRKSPYMLDPVEVNFYKPANLIIKVAADSADVPRVLNGLCHNSLYISHTLTLPPELARYNSGMVYCQYPAWLLRFNFNHWQERSYLWSVYRLNNK